MEVNRLSRRKFLSIATWVIGGLIGTGLGIPSLIYIIGNSLKQNQEQKWVRLGPASKVELGTPTLYKIKVKRQSGWIVNEEEVSFYILTEDGRDFIALSNICTHLGCRVRWVGDQGNFFCPCHNGVFDKQGGVVSGPPPRPLDRYDLKVEDGELYILGG